jgi:hypothetical protein
MHRRNFFAGLAGLSTLAWTTAALRAKGTMSGAMGNMTGMGNMPAMNGMDAPVMLPIAPLMVPLARNAATRVRSCDPNGWAAAAASSSSKRNQ